MASEQYYPYPKSYNEKVLLVFGPWVPWFVSAVVITRNRIHESVSRWWHRNDRDRLRCNEMALK